MTEAREKIIPVQIEDEMKKSYIDYAMSVIVGRALPDVRDGLKPVHRRILYAMRDLGLTPDKPHRKSARIVGDVLGKYHPHGDMAVYDAMVRMAQDFSIRYPLIDGHGNFGSIDGDSAAAMRYTEARLSPLAMEMLADINKDTVDFIPNFDETLKEPVVLPSRFPNLLVNGSSGIAVGMATNIPPHNLGEVIDGVIMMIDKPDVSPKELMMAVKGPDFPTGGLIMGREGIKAAYNTGRGQIKVRAKAHIEPTGGNKHQIIVTEIPYQVNKARLIEKIAELVKDKKIDGISDLRDESDRSGMRIVIELKKDANPNIVLNQLYKHTQMQITFGVIMLALVDGEPKILNLREMIYYYLEHQKEVVTRRTRFDLNKAEERAHILEGLRIALANLDAVIDLIKKSKDVETARQGLMTKFNLTEKQAQAILDMRLQRLTGLEREKIELEYKELIEKISYLKSILADEKLLLQVIKQEILEIKKKYSDERRTKITSAAEKLEIEDLIEEQDVVITITYKGYIKRLPLATYKSQRRGGRGITGITTKEEDYITQIITTTTHHYILFFTNQGNLYRLKAHEIPEAGRTAKGTSIINLLHLNPDEKITAVIPIKDFNHGTTLFMATKKGIVKKTPLSEYESTRKNGLIAINLMEDDELIGVELTDGNQQVVLGTRKGMCIRFLEEDVNEVGRTARGVKGIDLKPGDYVVSMDLVRDKEDILVVTENGFGKKTSINEYRVQSRAGKGIVTSKVTKKTGDLIGIKTVSEDDEVMIVSSDGIIIRLEVKDISRMGRNTQGVTLMKLNDENRVVAIALVEHNGE
ncbi:DNA gyrase subunit A [Koleobacter methoxysyntrophicus]|uniref:DNA gyrase subunit A n=1 Tax=Koleobacter methoxysyntrophicus TaxID=2751313 RepID=A0A8A0RLI8_9FIRM|nr:DNA gyrase subunit A [Koleobacter methoxysyntrophicus]QSQ08624.1 DNA gyrase subunit A [Koleobacter methoxysyntrophicus]